MIDDATWQRELGAALSSENVFIAQHPVEGGANLANNLTPTLEESVRAVDNIRVWRSYLPAPCVTRMIDEGWQWST